NAYTQFLLANGLARTPPMGHGNLRAKTSTFPSGIKALADYVHAKGLRLGIYSDAGFRTCSNTMPGSLGHELQDEGTFAQWGIDYLKYDNCFHDGSKPQERYTKMSYALLKAGRPILYSIWGTKIQRNGLVRNAWRTTGDIRDKWESITSIADQNNVWGRFAGPGRWNDPDMLEVGNGGMSLEEYRSHFSIWPLMKVSPLLIGYDIRSASGETLKILGNKEVIVVNQDPLGVPRRKIRSKGALEFPVTWREIGIPLPAPVIVRDLWRYEHSFVSMNKRYGLIAYVDPHACKMYILTPI
ncbi:hypothetical protein CISIN_1g044794mg, partial [Citrus sinensis]